MGLVAALVFAQLLSLLVHELGHAAGAARRCRGIVLVHLGRGPAVRSFTARRFSVVLCAVPVATATVPPGNPSDEVVAFIAAAGPAASLTFALVASLAGALLGGSTLLSAIGATSLGTFLVTALPVRWPFTLGGHPDSDGRIAILASSGRAGELVARRRRTAPRASAPARTVTLTQPSFEPWDTSASVPPPRSGR